MHFLFKIVIFHLAILVFGGRFIQGFNHLVAKKRQLGGFKYGTTWDSKARRTMASKGIGNKKGAVFVFAVLKASVLTNKRWRNHPEKKNEKHQVFFEDDINFKNMKNTKRWQEYLRKNHFLCLQIPKRETSFGCLKLFLQLFGFVFSPLSVLEKPSLAESKLRLLKVLRVDSKVSKKWR